MFNNSHKSNRFFENSFALENNDIIDGMQQCSAALSVMGTSYEDAFALFTGAQEIMQDADKVGNGLKSVAMRIRGYSEDAESGGYVVDESLKNISGDLIELTKVAGDPVLQNGISVYTDDTKYLDDAQKKYKSLVEYLGELADNWDKFSETTQTQLLQKLFAKTQATTGAAIISNFDQVRAALEAMENSAGSADAEMEKVEETITYKLNKLKEMWVGFLQDAASKELIKGSIDGLTTISELIIKILETPGLNIAAISGLLVALVKNFKNASTSISLVLNALKSFSGATEKLDRKATSESVFEILSKMAGNSTKAVKETADEVEEVGDAISNASSKASGSTSVITSLSTAFSSLAAKLGVSTIALGGFVAAIAAIGGIALYKTFKKESEYVENLTSDIEELTNTFNSSNSEIQSTISSIDSVSEKYQKLAVGVDKYGNNVSLSNDDFEEYNKISNQIADTFPELITGYSDTGVAILECKDNIDLLNEACKDKSFESYIELLSGDNMSKLGKAIGIVYNGYESDIFKIKTSGTDQQKEDLKAFEQELVNFQSIIKEATSKGYTVSSLLAANEAVSYGGVADQDAYEYYLKLSNILKQIADYGKEFNIDTSGIQLNYNVTADSLDSVIEGIIARFDLAESEIKSKEDEAKSNFDLMVDGILHSSEKFNTLDDTTLENLRKFLTSTADIKDLIDPFTNELKESDLRDWINELVEDNSWNKFENKLNELFSFDADSYSTIGEAQDALDKILDALAEYLNEDSNELKIKLGFDTVDNTIDKMVAAALQGTEVEKAVDENADRAIESYEQQIATAQRKYEKAVAKRKSQYSTSNIVGNVDLNNRNVAAGQTMAAAGWEGDGSTYSTIDTVTETFENLSDVSGETAFVVNITPILPTGEVLTQESYQDYLNYLMKNASSTESILNADKPENGGFGLVLGAFDTVTDKTGEQLPITWKNIGTAIDEASETAENYHNEQASIYDEEGAALLDMMGLIQKKNEKIQETTDAANAESEAELQAAELISNKKWSTDEQQAFLEFCIEAGDKYADFTEKVKAFEQQLATNKSTTNFSLTDFSETIEQLDDIKEAYDKVYENIKDNKTGKELASDINDVESLREAFDDLGDVDFGNYASFDEIEEVLTSGIASSEEVQNAWNQIATSLVNAKLAAGDYTEETQALISTQLQAAGVTKDSAEAFVESLTTLAQAKEVCTEAGKDITDMTDAEIMAFALEANQSAFTKEQLLLLEIAKYACNQAEINTVSDIEQLENLMIQAGATTLQLQDLASAKAAAASGEALLSKAQNSKSDADQQKYYQLAQEQFERATAEANKTASDYLDQYKSGMIDIGTAPTGNSSGSGGGGSSDSSDKEDAWVKEYEEQYDELKELRENNKIDEYDYVQYLRALYYKYYKDKEKYAENFAKAEADYLNSVKEMYEDVFSGLSGQIDDQISKLETAKSKASDSLNKQKTAAVNALKAEKAAAVAAIEEQIKAVKKQQEAIQDQIDAYQDEIDAINDANDAREREITLQKALYDLDKLNSQRTNLVYSESKGMHYESDLSGIRDARESVQDAKDDIAIANLEKKIDLLEKEKDALDDIIDKLEDQKDAIEDYYDNLIDETEAYWDQVISDMEAAYDAQIEALNNAKDEIEKFQNDIEKAELATKLAKMTGQSIDEIINALTSGDKTVLDELKAQYYAVIKDMYSGNQELLDQFTAITNCDFSTMSGYLEATESAFKGIENTNFDVVKNGIESIQTAFATLDDQIAVSNLFGEASTLAEKGKAAAEEAGQAYVGNLSHFFSSSEELADAGKQAVKTVADGMSSESASGETEEKAKEVGKNISDGVGKGMTSDEAKAQQQEDAQTVKENTVDAMKEAFEINSPSEVIASLVGLYVGLGVGKGIVDAANDPEMSGYITQFVDSLTNQLKSAFDNLGNSGFIDLGQILGITSTEDVEGAGTGSLSSIFQQLLDDITELNNQFQTIDISNVILQFTNLKQAIADASAALGGDGAAMMSTGTEGGSAGTGESGTGTSGSQKSSTMGGSLTEAMQTFGDTANEVLGGGEEGEGGGEDEEGGSGVIGKFTTLRSKVEDVTAAIGLGDDEGGSGGKSSGTGSNSEDGGTLIEALQAEQEVAMNEETGLPKQVSMWQELYDNINKCIEAVHRLIDALTELEEFSLTVIFKGHSKAGGTAEASGSIGYASGSMYVAGSAYAKGTAGLEKDQRALVGESGTEMLIRGNQWQLIGQHGAEYKDLKAGDIIFSAAQTKELMKHGKLRSRGHTVGGNSYADGTPLNGMFDFAGKELSSSALNNISAQLTGVLAPMTSSIDTINRNVADLAASVSNVSSVNQTSNITIGDIHVSGVQDTDSFAKAIKSYLPGKMMQELHK